MRSGETMEKQMNYKAFGRDFLVANAAAGAGILILFGALLLKQNGFIPNLPCAFHELFHLYCPGCGGTRAMFDLLKGQVLESLYHNPAVVLGIFLIAYYEIGAVVTLVKRNGRRYGHQGWPVYAYLGVVGLYSLVRDILLVMAGIDLLGDFL